jgi:ribulose-5-phosphate 4-epimerase/fuculose-1-phosphate aldolase
MPRPDRYRPAIAANSDSLRRELAAAYRLADRFGMSDLVSTHISVRLAGDPERMLMNDYGLLFNEVTASNLIEVTLDGRTVIPASGRVNPAGLMIHSTIHRARPDIVCVMHVHTVPAVAVSALADGLLPISQYALQFFGRIGYHDYEGIALLAGERQKLIDDLGQYTTLILRNHGIITTGRTIGEAYTLMNNLVRACEVQVMAQATGAPLIVPAEAICRLTAAQHEVFADRPVGDAEWLALMREVERFAPDYKN